MKTYFIQYNGNTGTACRTMMCCCMAMYMAMPMAWKDIVSDRGK